LNHKLDHRCSRTRVAVVGCGGTGSAFAGGLPYIHQSIVAEGQPGLNVVFVDGDRISSTNCVRQPFSQSEIGLYKALVIANRLNLFWGLKWCASTRDFTEKTDGIVDILITCVDTRAARLAITRSPAFKKTLYWLDIGNNADTGQFVLGQPRNRRNQRARYRLLTVAELYPEILDPKLDGSDTLPSCSSVEALKRQEPFVNQVLANHALALLARLFRHREVSYQGGFVNLATGQMAPIPVTQCERKRKHAARDSVSPARSGGRGRVPQVRSGERPA